MAEMKNRQVSMGEEQEFNDKDMLQDALISSKSLYNLYNIFTSEASNKDLLDNLNPLRNEFSKTQRNLFNLMFEMGWYVLEEEPQTKVKKRANQFKSLKKQLDSNQ